MSFFCSLCNVSCSSDYSREQHLNGRKHRQKELQTPSRTTTQNVCFNWQRGNCRYGSNCRFSHETPSASHATAIITPGSSTHKAVNATRKGNVVTGEFLLCKQTESNAEVKKDDTKENNTNGEGQKKLFSIFEKKPSPSCSKAQPTTEPSSKFPDIYRNAFRGRKNVSLSIRNEQVVWTFAYNATIISAIKNHIQGRAWNPEQKCWTSPLESLPDAVALYEFMGRSADESLHQRAKHIAKSLGEDASAAIRVTVEVDVSSSTNAAEPSTTTTNDDDQLPGRVRLNFLYNADTVAAIKCLCPSQRSYAPISKEWTIGLLDLPELLDEHWKPLGYVPSPELQCVSNACQTLQDRLYAQQVQPVSEDPEGSDKNENEIRPKEYGNQLQQEEVEAALTTILQQLQGNQGRSAIDRSDCGPAPKKRRITYAQKVWTLKQKGLWDGDDYSYEFDDDDGHYESDPGGDDEHGDAWISTCSFYAASAAQSFLKRSTPATNVDCDCGQPWRTSAGGRHVCRYFGSFECQRCHHFWTSAYCWEGEKQACRRCNAETFPTKKERLRTGEGGGGGVHDSARCSMCQRLGYNCSL